MKLWLLAMASREREMYQPLSLLFRASDIADVAATSIEQALVGRMAGVQITQPNGTPGAGFEVKVRGVGTVTAGSSPLYVIDGVYGDINMVDPSDIQSIEVLKDASAAAIYGSRAANGVVLITTKGGRKDMPTKVTVDAYTGIQWLLKNMM